MYEQQAFRDQEKHENAQTLGASLFKRLMNQRREISKLLSESGRPDPTVEITDTGQNRADTA